MLAVNNQFQITCQSHGKYGQHGFCIYKITTAGQIHMIAVIFNNLNKFCLLYTSECCILDLLKGLFCFPAMHGYRLILACCNGAACLVNKSKRNQQQMKQALLGILFSIPLFLIVICLLVTADHTFWQFCNNISSLAQPNSLTIIQLIMTGVVALYLFGLFYGCFYVASQGKTKKLTVAPSVASGFMILFLLVYTLFFVDVYKRQVFT